VKGAGVFGGEDLSCILIRTKIALPRSFARATYSMCGLGAPKLERGEIKDVVEDRTRPRKFV